MCEHCAAVGRQDSSQAFEQRGLTGAVRADQPEHLACSYVKADIRQRGDLTESFGKVLDLKQHLFHQTAAASIAKGFRSRKKTTAAISCAAIPKTTTASKE